jgi:hypothetical protein
VVVRIFVRFTGATVQRPIIIALMALLSSVSAVGTAGGGGNGNARVSDGWHGAYVAGRQSVIATLHGKLTEADQRTLIKAGWWHLHAGLRRLQSGPQGDFLCRELPAHTGNSLFPGDGYFCVVAPGPYATTP